MPKGLLLIAKGKHDEEDDYDKHEEEAEEDDACQVLADILDVPKDKYKAFKNAIKTIVRETVAEEE